MFYRNTRYTFPLPAGSPDTIQGAIIAAGALGFHRLGRAQVLKDLEKMPYLKRRLLDPQLYLSGLDGKTATKRVKYLATYPWFHDVEVPPFDTKIHRRLDAWAAEIGVPLAKAWKRRLPQDPNLVQKRALTAVQFQKKFGVPAMILPGPLTANANAPLDSEVMWLDAGLQAARSEEVEIPVFATVALKQDVLSGYAPDDSPLLERLVDQVSAREADGVYLLMEQQEEAYSFANENTLRSLLALVSDFRRTGLRVMVNHLGVFGAILTAAGAEVWSSDFYRSCRRIRVLDMDDSKGLQYPRYFSTALLGDVGLEEDLEKIRDKGMLDRILTDTPPAQVLHDALRSRVPISGVEEWLYKPGKVTAAKAHYLHCMMRIGGLLEPLTPKQRIERVARGLKNAESLAQQLMDAGIRPSAATELRHQAAWRDAFDWWVKRERGL